MLYFLIEKEHLAGSSIDQGKPFGRMGHKAIGPDGIIRGSQLPKI